MRFSGETHTAAASTAPSNKGREDISLAMRFPKQEPRCTCRAEGTLRLQRQTGALHLARASPSATRTESGGKAGGGRTMTACWNAAVRCERRSSGVCRHGPPEPARGPSRSLQDSGRQPAPATLSPHGRASRPSSSLEPLEQREGKRMAAKSFPLVSRASPMPKACNRLVLGDKSPAGSGGGGHAGSTSSTHFARKASHQLGAGLATSLVLASPATAWCWQNTPRAPLARC